MHKTLAQLEDAIADMEDAEECGDLEERFEAIIQVQDAREAVLYRRRILAIAKGNNQ